MRTRSRFTLVAAAAVLALLLSSCWQISRVSVNRWVISVDADTKSAVTLDLIKSNPELTSEGYAFLVIGYDSSQMRNAGRTWDTQGNYGGPFSGVKDGSLRNQLLAGSACSLGQDTNLSDLEGDFPTWIVFRTANQIDFATVTQDDVLRVKQFFKPANGAITPLPGAFVFVSGWWGDANDNGVVNAFEVQCQATYGGALFVDD
jgi:hypothetical protein